MKIEIEMEDIKNGIIGLIAYILGMGVLTIVVGTILYLYGAL